jgi:hypothetical protein
MNTIIKRPSPGYRTPKGLLGREHFQVAYVTNDLGRGLAVFRERFGITEFTTLETERPEGDRIRVDLAWAGAVMFELITASGAAVEFYNKRLPAGQFALQFHHLGYMIRDEAEWTDLTTEIVNNGLAVVSSGAVPDFMRFCFVEIPEFGHYLEFIMPEPAGVTFFENVAR